MSVRNFPYAPDNGGISKGTGLSGASTGVKLTYTVPTGHQAEVTLASVFPTAGAATIQIRATQSGTTTILQSSTGAQQFTGRLQLNAGDSVTINVSVLDAAGVFDANIDAREYPVT